MNRSARSIGFIVVGGLSLVACGKQSDDDFSVTSAPVEKGRVEDQLGKGFGEAFRASPMSEPAVVSKNDVVPVSRTAEPLEVR